MTLKLRNIEITRRIVLAVNCPSGELSATSCPRRIVHAASCPVTITLVRLIVGNLISLTR